MNLRHKSMQSVVIGELIKWYRMCIQCRGNWDLRVPQQHKSLSANLGSHELFLISSSLLLLRFRKVKTTQMHAVMCWNHIVKEPQPASRGQKHFLSFNFPLTLCHCISSGLRFKARVHTHVFIWVYAVSSSNFTRSSETSYTSL